MKKKIVIKPEPQIPVALTEDEWFWLLTHTEGWPYLRKKIFHALVSERYFIQDTVLEKSK